MNFPNHILQLIKKELEGKLSPEERLILDEWYKNLDNSGDVDFDSRKEKNLNRIRGAMAPKPSYKIDFSWIGWAAAVVIVFIGMFEVYNNKYSTESAVETLVEERFEEFVNPRGVRRQLTLPDGSKIFLNGNSKVKISKQFSANRKVFLKGEAFFDVEKDSANPFVVVTEGLETRVLGTAFTVSAFEGKPQVVAVKEGKVKVSESHEGITTDSNLLIANEQLTFKEGIGLGSKQRINPNKKFAWINGKIIFDKTPINEVFAVLSDWYGLESVELSDKNMNCFVTGTYTKMTLEDIMESIKYATGIAYEINGKQLKVKKGNC
jgi:ferric-dicitrate binding protein FerR (iron transport regulator)